MLPAPGLGPAPRATGLESYQSPESGRAPAPAHPGTHSAWVLLRVSRGQSVSRYFSAGKKSVPAKTPQKWTFRSGSTWKRSTWERRRSESGWYFQPG